MNVRLSLYKILNIYTRKAPHGFHSAFCSVAGYLGSASPRMYEMATRQLDSSSKTGSLVSARARLNISPIPIRQRKRRVLATDSCSVTVTAWRTYSLTASLDAIDRSEPAYTALRFQWSRIN